MKRLVNGQVTIPIVECITNISGWTKKGILEAISRVFHSVNKSESDLKSKPEKENLIQLTMLFMDGCL